MSSPTVGATTATLHPLSSATACRAITPTTAARVTVGGPGELTRLWSDCGSTGRRYRRARVGTRWLTVADDLVGELVAHLPDRRTGDTVVLSERVAALLMVGRAAPRESAGPGPLARLLSPLRRRPVRLSQRESQWLCRCLERALGTGVAIVAHGRSVRATSPLSLPAQGLRPVLADDPLGHGLDATPFVLVRPAPERWAPR